MSNPILELGPVADLKEELAKFAHLPPYLLTGQAAKVMKLSSPGAVKLHERCEKISAGRDDLGHRLYRRDGCVAHRWFRLSFLSLGANAEPQGWDASDGNLTGKGGAHE
ncbi:hypothetical protein [Roseibium sp. MMSF_3544]|uniref:hypothetical protein n=1 Tax=unclassified Roseibium TaxID=2629323 RepID=UPI002740015A|nr:hypothetical protein [Roseibium sp. MMSF_3544]